MANLCIKLNIFFSPYRGFVSLGYPAVVLTIFATLIGKGIVFPFLASVKEGRDFVFNYDRATIWIGINFIPPFLYVSKEFFML